MVLLEKSGGIQRRKQSSGSEKLDSCRKGNPTAETSNADEETQSKVGTRDKGQLKDDKASQDQGSDEYGEGTMVVNDDDANQAQLKEARETQHHGSEEDGGGSSTAPSNSQSMREEDGMYRAKVLVYRIDGPSDS